MFGYEMMIEGYPNTPMENDRGMSLSSLIYNYRYTTDIQSLAKEPRSQAIFSNWLFGS